jgi:transcriptional antiterminator NusG
VNDQPDNTIDARRPGDVVVGPPSGAHDEGQPSVPASPPPGDELALPGDELALPSDELALPGAELALSVDQGGQPGDATDPVGGASAAETDAHDDSEARDDADDDDEIQAPDETSEHDDDQDEKPLAAVRVSDGGDSANGAGTRDHGSGPEGGAIEHEPRKMDWFILKVQSNREDSIREALLRRIAVAGLGESFDQIIVPIEKVSEFKNGKKRIVKRKLYPGYLVVHMEYNDDTWYLVRETPGIGDFTGSGGKPTPMAPHEVSKIISIIEPDKPDETPRINIPYKKGDRVKINEGTFENFEGDVDHIDEANGRVTVMINIFGRSTPVELEYWQIEKL